MILVVIYAKILHHSLIPTIFEEIQFFYLSRTHENLETCLFDLSNWKNQSSFEVLSLDILINGHYLKKNKISCLVKTTIYEATQFLYDCHLHWNNYSKSFILNSCTLSIFPALEIRKLIVTFRHSIVHMVNLFVLLSISQLTFHMKLLKFYTRKY